RLVRLEADGRIGALRQSKAPSLAEREHDNGFVHGIALQTQRILKGSCAPVCMARPVRASAGLRIWCRTVSKNWRGLVTRRGTPRAPGDAARAGGRRARRATCAL